MTLLAEALGFEGHMYTVAEVFPEYIGQERAKKLAAVLHCDYRQML